MNHVIRMPGLGGDLHINQAGFNDLKSDMDGTRTKQSMSKVGN